jgi:hypothetical protein
MVKVKVFVMSEAFFVDNCRHDKGLLRCEECLGGYPKRCRCGGLIHANHGLSDWNGAPVVNILCEGCGTRFRKQKGQEEPKPFSPPKCRRRRF